MMPVDIRKDTAAQRELERLISKLEGRVRRAFEGFIRDVKSDAVFKEITRLIRDGQIDEALRIVDSHILRIGNTNSRLKFPLGPADFMNRWCAEGPTHHCALGVGHVKGEIRRVARLMGLELVEVS